MSARMPALFAAQSVALSARTRCLTGHAVDDMRTKAEELLPKGDTLRQAILTFATMYEQHRRDPQAVVVLGEALEADVSRALLSGASALSDPAHWPAPVDLDRSDIHG
jgi:hypothetical protein